jgi:hypothetical protein
MKIYSRTGAEMAFTDIYAVVSAAGFKEQVKYCPQKVSCQIFKKMYEYMMESFTTYCIFLPQLGQYRSSTKWSQLRQFYPYVIYLLTCAVF